MMFGMRKVSEAKSVAEAAARKAGETDAKLQEAFRDNCKALARYMGHDVGNDNRGEK